MKKLKTLSPFCSKRSKDPLAELEKDKEWAEKEVASLNGEVGLITGENLSSIIDSYSFSVQCTARASQYFCFVYDLLKVLKHLQLNQQLI